MRITTEEARKKATRREAVTRLQAARDAGWSVERIAGSIPTSVTSVLRWLSEREGVIPSYFLALRILEKVTV